MNTCITVTTPETLQQYQNTPERSSISLLERRQYEQTPLNYNVFSSAAQNFLGSSNAYEEDLDGLIALKLKPVFESYCDDFGSITQGDFLENYGNILSGHDTNSSLARTLSYPEAVSAGAVNNENESAANNGKEIIPSEKQSWNFNKRKTDKNMHLQEAKEGDNDKKLKGCTEVRNSMSKEKSNTTNNSTDDNKADILKEKFKTSAVQKLDYVHVRARRGEATDSHSLAERVRREKISAKMKYLQNLVPGCNSIGGKTGMLDEIINYVQALQRQIEFLSMKLAVVYPGPDFNDVSYYTKEVFPASTSDFHHPIEAFQPETCLPQNYQSDVLQQAVSSNGLKIGVDVPVSVPETIFESPCFNHLQSCSPSDVELQGIFDLEFQQITGINEMIINTRGIVRSSDNISPDFTPFPRALYFPKLRRTNDDGE